MLLWGWNTGLHDVFWARPTIFILHLHPSRDTIFLHWHGLLGFERNIILFIDFRGERKSQWLFKIWQCFRSTWIVLGKSPLSRKSFSIYLTNWEILNSYQVKWCTKGILVKKGTFFLKKENLFGLFKEKWWFCLIFRGKISCKTQIAVLACKW